jgi:hypothetical protein
MKQLLRITTDVCFVTHRMTNTYLSCDGMTEVDFLDSNSSKYSCLLYSQQENKIHLTDVKNVMLVCVLLHALWIITQR